MSNEKDQKKELIELVDSYKRITRFVILIFENDKSETKQIILRNFIAKSHSLLNSISILISENQEGEAMALYRLLIERYFYLEYLEQKNKYQEFKDWSYIKTFESRNNTRSKSEFNDSMTKDYLKDSPEQIRKYQDLKKKNIDWIEPKLEKFAKELNLSFLYSMGYDLGSSFIHPRADEGYWDALRIVNNDQSIEFRKLNILKNSVLIANSILIYATNKSSIDFGRFLNLYCNSIFAYLNEGKEFPKLKDIEKVFYGSILHKFET
ncbi:DUF5677 domain-containing protein [Gillisia sp. JM1]|uniref:DUF5677 domain-containing protein n=1 Tax=Gillisia sp. JM1 TaxID=1283286 RepID=UPI0004043E60|nr:DUF5677 domain-containing protein [Gillisia sp. JM1]